MKQSKILIISYAALSLIIQQSAFSEVSIVKDGEGGSEVSTVYYSAIFGSKGSIKPIRVGRVELRNRQQETINRFL